MADENSNVPPQPSEAPKVAPKKETVRISLPPKPTASPTIKLPAMPAGAPAAAKAAPAAAPAAPAAAPASRAPAPPTPPKGGASVKVSAPAPSSSGPRPVAASRPVAHSAQVTVLDKVLAIVAMIVSLGAAGSLFMLYQIFVNNPSP
jgi:hypothetical protein